LGIGLCRHIGYAEITGFRSAAIDGAMLR
jgi:hypothetical protein